MPKAKRKSRNTKTHEINGVRSSIAIAKSYLNRTSNGKKAAFAAGGLALLALLTSKMGRGFVKTIGGVAMPILAGVARRKATEQIAQRI